MRQTRQCKRRGIESGTGEIEEARFVGMAEFEGRSVAGGTYLPPAAQVTALSNERSSSTKAVDDSGELLEIDGLSEVLGEAGGFGGGDIAVHAITAERDGGCGMGQAAE